MELLSELEPEELRTLELLFTAPSSVVGDVGETEGVELADEEQAECDPPSLPLLEGVLEGFEGERFCC